MANKNEISLEVLEKTLQDIERAQLELLDGKTSIETLEMNMSNAYDTYNTANNIPLSTINYQARIILRNTLEHLDLKTTIFQFTFITSNTDHLCNLIYVEFGLLDRLQDDGVLSHKQCTRIRDTQGRAGQSIRLLEEILRDGEENLKAFLEALDETQHRHVANYIRGEGHYSEKYGEEWPLTSVTRRVLDKNISKFKDVIDSSLGLLDEMLAMSCINMSHKWHADSLPTDTDRNQFIHDIIYRGSRAVYNGFIQCLRRTNQHHWVSLLAPDATGNVRPVDDLHTKRLQQNWPTLIESIEIKHSRLLGGLFASECITRRQREYIESGVLASECNGRLLEIVGRGSESNFHQFLELLGETGQQHIRRIFTEDCTEAHVVARNHGNNEIQEDDLFDSFMSILRKSSPAKRKELSDKVQQCVNDANDREKCNVATPAATMKTSCSTSLSGGYNDNDADRLTTNTVGNNLSQILLNTNLNLNNIVINGNISFRPSVSKTAYYDGTSSE